MHNLLFLLLDGWTRKRLNVNKQIPVNTLLPWPNSPSNISRFDLPLHYDENGKVVFEETEAFNAAAAVASPPPVAAPAESASAGLKKLCLFGKKEGKVNRKESRKGRTGRKGKEFKKGVKKKKESKNKEGEYTASFLEILFAGR